MVQTEPPRIPHQGSKMKTVNIIIGPSPAIVSAALSYKPYKRLKPLIVGLPPAVVTANWAELNITLRTKEKKAKGEMNIYDMKWWEYPEVDRPRYEANWEFLEDLDRKDSFYINTLHKDTWSWCFNGKLDFCLLKVRHEGLSAINLSYTWGKVDMKREGIKMRRFKI